MARRDLDEARSDLGVFAKLIGHPLAAFQLAALLLVSRVTYVTGPRQRNGLICEARSREQALETCRAKDSIRVATRSPPKAMNLEVIPSSPFSCRWRRGGEAGLPDGTRVLARTVPDPLTRQKRVLRGPAGGN